MINSQSHAIRMLALAVLLASGVPAFANEDTDMSAEHIEVTSVDPESAEPTGQKEDARLSVRNEQSQKAYFSGISRFGSGIYRRCRDI